MFARVPGALPQATVNVAFGQNFGPKMGNFKVPGRHQGHRRASERTEKWRDVFVMPCFCHRGVSGTTKEWHDRNVSRSPLVRNRNMTHFKEPSAFPLAGQSAAFSRRRPAGGGGGGLTACIARENLSFGESVGAEFQRGRGDLQYQSRAERFRSSGLFRAERDPPFARVDSPLESHPPNPIRARP